MTARFRPLGADGTADPAPPEFATAPWGYRRAEVDSWASWVAGLVAHGRAETVRADSAEATLRATLERLERLETSGPSTPSDDCGGLPRREPRGASGRGTTARWSVSGPGIETVRDSVPKPAPSAPVTPPPGPPRPGGSAPPRHDGPRPPDAEGAGTPDRPQTTDAARLQIVENTLHEVMQLLDRLVGPEPPVGS